MRKVARVIIKEVVVRPTPPPKQKGLNARFVRAFAFIQGLSLRGCPQATQSAASQGDLVCCVPKRLSLLWDFTMNSGKNIIHKNIYLLSLTRIIFVMLMQLPFCVYILFSEKDNLLYTGFSTNLENRIKNHNDGGTKSTAYRRPLKLIFCEFYLYEEEARKREKYFKTTIGGRKQ